MTAVLCVSQEKEMEKQKILYQQARLHARGAAEMVLQMISASKGNNQIISVFNSCLFWRNVSLNIAFSTGRHDANMVGVQV